MNKLRPLNTLVSECRRLSHKTLLKSCSRSQLSVTRGKQCLASSLKWNKFETTVNCQTSFRCLQSRWCSTATSVKSDQVTSCETGKILQLEWPNGSKSRFHSIWLRHNCHCPDCKQQDSGQKTLDIVNISDISIKSAKLTDDGVQVEWSCGHVGVLPTHYLQSNAYTSEALQHRAEEVRLTETCTAKSVPTMEYSELTQSQNNILSWLKIINKYGFCLLTSVPLGDQMVKQVAEMIDRAQFSIYGELFDVVSTPEPINIAYTNVSIDLHMDLVYYESPPGLQLLHAIRFDECVEGGESVFLDAYQVAEDFRKQHPDHFQTLVEVPATFQKIHYSRESPVHMTYQRPHIVLNRNREIVNVNWAPAFEGSLSVPESDVERYYHAYQKFAIALKESPYRIIRQLKLGDLVIFNNRRILHGRHSFELNGGVRHLKGCYVNIDHFKSRLQVLSNTIGDGSPAKRVGNQDWF